MSSDKTKFVVRKLIRGEHLEEDEQELLEDSFMRNSTVSKTVILVVTTIGSIIIAVITAKLTGLF